MIYFAVLDGAGIYGSLYHYTSVIAFVGSAFLIFLYLWKINRLDMDEEPKYQMMQEEDLIKKDDKLKEDEKHHESSPSNR